MIEAIFDGYRRWISPALHSISGVSGACRFQPTCSEYAAQALSQHGALRGTVLAAWRLLRCTPFSKGGWDPIPDPVVRPGLRPKRPVPETDSAPNPISDPISDLAANDAQPSQAGGSPGKRPPPSLQNEPGSHLP